MNYDEILKKMKEKKSDWIEYRNENLNLDHMDHQLLYDLERSYKKMKKRNNIIDELLKK